MSTIDRMFDELLLRYPRRAVWEPPIEMFETATEVIVRAELPRTLRLSVPVKGPEVKVVYKDGVLEVRIPKAEHVKPIPVKVLTAV